MKKLWNKYFSTLRRKITLGISLIVFSTTLLVAIIFLTQYRRLSLSQSETELKEKAVELAKLGNALYSPNPIMQERFLSTLRSMTDTEFWILDEDGAITIRTTGFTLNEEMTDKNKDIIGKLTIQDDVIIKYDFINYPNAKILTVIAPIKEGQSITGAILLHKNVNSIYNSYTSFISLIVISLIASSLLSILLAIVFSNYITKPITQITKVTSEIKDGNYNAKTNIIREDEIGMLANTIDNMSTEINKNIEEIKELENRAKQLVANVSHEFKTPLTLIRGYTLNLQDNIIEPSKEIYEKIVNNTRILEKLVNELLDLNAYESNKIILNLESLSLTNLLDDTINDMIYIAKSKNIEIKKEFTKDLIIEADYVKVRQLITIFLDNAIKYSTENNIIEVKLQDNEIIIKDNGIGMEKSELEKLFERYYRVNNNELGYGLGMCIAKYIADLHNFKIDIKSKKNKGTTVKIIL